MKEMIKKLQRKSNKKGFTLVEIIVVLVILAILAAIAVPAVLGYVNDAKESKYVQEARSIYIVIQTEEAKFRAENGLNTKSTITYGDAEAVTAPDANGATDAAKNGSGVMKKSDLVKTIQDKTEFTNVDVTKDGTKYTLKWTSDKAVEAELTTNKDVKIK